MAEELDDEQQQGVQLPKGYEDANPVQLPKGYEDAAPASSSVSGATPSAAPAGPSTLERGMGAFNKGVGMDMSAPPQKPSIGEMIAGPIVPAVKGVLESSSSAAQTGANRFHQPGIVNKIGGGLEYGLSGIPIVGPGIVTAMEHGAKQEWPEMLGSTAAAATQMAAPEMEENGAGIGNAIDSMNPVNWRSGIRSKMYDANGELTPGAHAIVHPTELAEYGAKKLFPEPEESVRARNANANYEQTAQDLMRRGVQQDRLDAQAARVAKSIAPKKGIINLDAGTTTLPGKLSSIANPEPFVGPEGSVTSVSTGKVAPKFGPPEEVQPNRIVSHDSPPLPQKRNLDSYPREELVEMAKQGGPAGRMALDYLQRNPGKFGVKSVPNSKYMIEPNAPTLPWRNKDQ